MISVSGSSDVTDNVFRSERNSDSEYVDSPTLNQGQIIVDRQPFIFEEDSYGSDDDYEEYVDPGDNIYSDEEGVVGEGFVYTDVDPLEERIVHHIGQLELGYAECSERVSRLQKQLLESAESAGLDVDRSYLNRQRSGSNIGADSDLSAEISHREFPPEEIYLADSERSDSEISALSRRRSSAWSGSNLTDDQKVDIVIELESDQESIGSTEAQRGSDNYDSDSPEGAVGNSGLNVSPSNSERSIEYSYEVETGKIHIRDNTTGTDSDARLAEVEESFGGDQEEEQEGVVEEGAEELEEEDMEYRPDLHVIDELGESCASDSSCDAESGAGSGKQSARVIRRTVSTKSQYTSSSSSEGLSISSLTFSSETQSSVGSRKGHSLTSWSDSYCEESPPTSASTEEDWIFIPVKNSNTEESQEDEEHDEDEEANAYYQMLEDSRKSELRLQLEILDETRYSTIEELSEDNESVYSGRHIRSLQKRQEQSIHSESDDYMSDQQDPYSSTDDQDNVQRMRRPQNRMISSLTTQNLSMASMSRSMGDLSAICMGESFEVPSDFHDTETEPDESDSNLEDRKKDAYRHGRTGELHRNGNTDVSSNVRIPITVSSQNKPPNVVKPNTQPRGLIANADSFNELYASTERLEKIETKTRTVSSLVDQKSEQQFGSSGNISTLTEQPMVPQKGLSSQHSENPSQPYSESASQNQNNLPADRFRKAGPTSKKGGSKTITTISQARDYLTQVLGRQVAQMKNQPDGKRGERHLSDSAAIRPASSESLPSRPMSASDITLPDSHGYIEHFPERPASGSTLSYLNSSQSSLEMTPRESYQDTDNNFDRPNGRRGGRYSTEYRDGNNHSPSGSFAARPMSAESLPDRPSSSESSRQSDDTMSFLNTSQSSLDMTPRPSSVQSERPYTEHEHDQKRVRPTSSQSLPDRQQIAQTSSPGFTMGLSPSQQNGYEAKGSQKLVYAGREVTITSSIKDPDNVNQTQNNNTPDFDVMVNGRTSTPDLSTIASQNSSFENSFVSHRDEFEPDISSLQYCASSPVHSGSYRNTNESKESQSDRTSALFHRIGYRERPGSADRILGRLRAESSDSWFSSEDASNKRSTSLGGQPSIERREKFLKKVPFEIQLSTHSILYYLEMEAKVEIVSQQSRSRQRGHSEYTQTRREDQRRYPVRRSRSESFLAIQPPQIGISSPNKLQNRTLSTELIQVTDIPGKDPRKPTAKMLTIQFQAGEGGAETEFVTQQNMDTNYWSSSSDVRTQRADGYQLRMPKGEMSRSAGDLRGVTVQDHTRFRNADTINGQYTLGSADSVYRQVSHSHQQSDSGSPLPGTEENSTDYHHHFTHENGQHRNRKLSRNRSLDYINVSDGASGPQYHHKSRECNQQSKSKFTSGPQYEFDGRRRRSSFSGFPSSMPPDQIDLTLLAEVNRSFEEGRTATFNPGCQKERYQETIQRKGKGRGLVNIQVICSQQEAALKAQSPVKKTGPQSTELSELHLGVSDDRKKLASCLLMQNIEDPNTSQSAQVYVDLASSLKERNTYHIGQNLQSADSCNDSQRQTNLHGEEEQSMNQRDSRRQELSISSRPALTPGSLSENMKATNKISSEREGNRNQFDSEKEEEQSISSQPTFKSGSLSENVTAPNKISGESETNRNRLDSRKEEEQDLPSRPTMRHGSLSNKVTASNKISDEREENGNRLDPRKEGQQRTSSRPTTRAGSLSENMTSPKYQHSGVNNKDMDGVEQTSGKELRTQRPQVGTQGGVITPSGDQVPHRDSHHRQFSHDRTPGSEDQQVTHNDPFHRHQDQESQDLKKNTSSGPLANQTMSNEDVNSRKYMFPNDEESVHPDKDIKHLQSPSKPDIRRRVSLGGTEERIYTEESDIDSANEFEPIYSSRKETDYSDGQFEFQDIEDPDLDYPMQYTQQDIIDSQREALRDILQDGDERGAQIDEIYVALEYGEDDEHDYETLRHGRTERNAYIEVIDDEYQDTRKAYKMYDDIAKPSAEKEGEGGRTMQRGKEVPDFQEPGSNHESDFADVSDMESGRESEGPGYESPSNWSMGETLDDTSTWQSQQGQDPTHMGIVPDGDKYNKSSEHGPYGNEYTIYHQNVQSNIVHDEDFDGSKDRNSKIDLHAQNNQPTNSYVMEQYSQRSSQKQTHTTQSPDTSGNGNEQQDLTISTTIIKSSRTVSKTTVYGYDKASGDGMPLGQFGGSGPDSEKGGNVENQHTSSANSQGDDDGPRRQYLRHGGSGDDGNMHQYPSLGGSADDGNMQQYPRHGDSADDEKMQQHSRHEGLPDDSDMQQYPRHRDSADSGNMQQYYRQMGSADGGNMQQYPRYGGWADEGNMQQHPKHGGSADGGNMRQHPSHGGSTENGSRSERFGHQNAMHGEVKHVQEESGFGHAAHLDIRPIKTNESEYVVGHEVEFEFSTSQFVSNESDGTMLQGDARIIIDNRNRHGGSDGISDNHDRHQAQHPNGSRKGISSMHDFGNIDRGQPTYRDGVVDEGYLQQHRRGSGSDNGNTPSGHQPGTGSGTPGDNSISVKDNSSIGHETISPGYDDRERREPSHRDDSKTGLLQRRPRHRGSGNESSSNQLGHLGESNTERRQVFYAQESGSGDIAGIEIIPIKKQEGDYVIGQEIEFELSTSQLGPGAGVGGDGIISGHSPGQDSQHQQRTHRGDDLSRHHSEITNNKRDSGTFLEDDDTQSNTAHDASSSPHDKDYHKQRVPSADHERGNGSRVAISPHSSHASGTDTNDANQSHMDIHPSHPQTDQLTDPTNGRHPQYVIGQEVEVDLGIDHDDLPRNTSESYPGGNQSKGSHSNDPGIAETRPVSGRRPIADGADGLSQEEYYKRYPSDKDQNEHRGYDGNSQVGQGGQSTNSESLHLDINEQGRHGGRYYVGDEIEFQFSKHEFESTQDDDGAVPESADSSHITDSDLGHYTLSPAGLLSSDKMLQHMEHERSSPGDATHGHRQTKSPSRDDSNSSNRSRHHDKDGIHGGDPNFRGRDKESMLDDASTGGDSKSKQHQDGSRKDGVDSGNKGNRNGVKDPKSILRRDRSGKSPRGHRHGMIDETGRDWARDPDGGTVIKDSKRSSGGESFVITTKGSSFDERRSDDDREKSVQDSGHSRGGEQRRSEGGNIQWGAEDENDGVQKDIRSQGRESDSLYGTEDSQGLGEDGESSKDRKGSSRRASSSEAGDDGVPRHRGRTTSGSEQGDNIGDKTSGRSLGGSDTNLGRGGAVHDADHQSQTPQRSADDRVPAFMSPVSDRSRTRSLSPEGARRALFRDKHLSSARPTASTSDISGRDKKDKTRSEYDSRRQSRTGQHRASKHAGK